MSGRRRVLGCLACLLGCSPAPQGTPTERITIPPGATFAAITDTLVQRGILESPQWFRLVARASQGDRRIKSGSYDLPRGASAWWILRTLQTGRSVLTRFTVPEGVTLVEVAQLAEAQLGIPPDSFLVAARDPGLLRLHNVPGSSFEGFLRPETYFVPLTVSGRDLVRQMAAAFQSAWDTTWDAAAAAHGLSRVGFVTLASIVEGEARVADERPVIAAVYLNRLRIGMPLQADPTVQYAIQLRTGARKTRLLLKDYDLDSPYNTYQIAGLPPGPVGLPGQAALEAVAAPAEVPWLFFVAGDSGRHVFTRNYADHLRAIRRIRGGGTGNRE
ncbi:MAG: endolytic transglycosylase MltG [Gemmatimonadota bacterium]|nr:endolytic transglycosylase MltG [Gemmatimonadota bacterium]